MVFNSEGVRYNSQYAVHWWRPGISFVACTPTPPEEWRCSGNFYLVTCPECIKLFKLARYH